MYAFGSQLIARPWGNCHLEWCSQLNEMDARIFAKGSECYLPKQFPGIPARAVVSKDNQLQFMSFDMAWQQHAQLHVWLLCR